MVIDVARPQTSTAAAVTARADLRSQGARPGHAALWCRPAPRTVRSRCWPGFAEVEVAGGWDVRAEARDGDASGATRKACPDDGRPGAAAEPHRHPLWTARRAVDERTAVVSAACEDACYRCPTANVRRNANRVPCRVAG